MIFPIKTSDIYNEWYPRILLWNSENFKFTLLYFFMSTCATFSLLYGICGTQDALDYGGKVYLGYYYACAVKEGNYNQPYVFATRRHSSMRRAVDKDEDQSGNHLIYGTSLWVFRRGKWKLELASSQTCFHPSLKMASLVNSSLSKVRLEIWIVSCLLEHNLRVQQSILDCDRHQCNVKVSLTFVNYLNFPQYNYSPFKRPKEKIRGRPTSVSVGLLRQ